MAATTINIGQSYRDLCGEGGEQEADTQDVPDVGTTGLGAYTV